MELVAQGPEALTEKKKKRKWEEKINGCSTHITEGINLLRSASPNVSITTPPGTTPALLLAAGRQLIWAKTENEREEKNRRKTGQSAAFGSLLNDRKTEKRLKTSSLLTLVTDGGTAVLMPGQTDNFSSFLSYQNKSDISPLPPVYFRKVIKEDRPEAGVTLDWRGARTP